MTIPLNEDGYPEVNVGDRISLTTSAGDAPSNIARFSDPTTRIFSGGSNGTGQFIPGNLYPVTRVTRRTLSVRLPNYFTSDRDTTVIIPREWFMEESRNIYGLLHADYVPPRRLGGNPDTFVTVVQHGVDTQERTIGIDDPRIQWIWEDLATYATDKNWCDQYDRLAKAIGIPGRPRDIKVSRVIEGLTITQTFSARSKREAEELMDAALTAVGMPLGSRRADVTAQLNAQPF